MAIRIVRTWHCPNCRHNQFELFPRGEIGKCNRCGKQFLRTVKYIEDCWSGTFYCITCFPLFIVFLFWFLIDDDLKRAPDCGPFLLFAIISLCVFP